MVDQDIQSLHLLYLTHNQKASYSQLCQYFSAKLRSASFTDDDIKHLLTIKTKMSYVVYACKMHTLTDADTILDKLNEHFNKKTSWSESEAELQFLVNHFQDKLKYTSFSWMISEERKKYSHIHDMEAGPVKDLQDLTISMDYIDHVRLAKYRQSCVIQQPDVEFSHELSSVQEKFDMCYDAISQHLNNLRHHIYRVDRDSSGMLRVMRSLYDITERNVEQEIDKCRLRTDYILFCLRQWRSMSQEIKHIFNNNPTMMTKMDKQIETSIRYIERILQLSFVMTRQPDDINVMQTPSTHRILREREFIKGSFLAYNPNCPIQWINISSACQMYLIGLNEYKSSDSVLENFSPNRKTAYEGDLYEPKGSRSNSNNPQKFVGSDVCFPRVHMINQNLKRRCREINTASNKRKHEDVVNCNAAPEEIFSFVLNFDVSYDVRAPWNKFVEDGAAARRSLNLQTCSKPVAILVHASQKPLAEGKLFWCRFNPKWYLPLHEETSVTAENFKKTLYEYTFDNFGRELSGRELDYLMSQITLDHRQGHKLVAKSVLKDEAQYTEPSENPPKRKSFWCWFYDIVVFLGKGKGKPATKCNQDNPLKKHWRDGRICLLSKAEAQSILSKLGPATSGAVIRVSESKPRFLNVLSCNNKSWGVGDKDVDGMDQILLNKFTYIWSECKENWIRTDQIIKPRVVDNEWYKPLSATEPALPSAPSTPTHSMPQTTVGCMSPAAMSSCMSPADGSPINYPSNFPPSPFISVQGGGTEEISWSRRSNTPSQESYISTPPYTEAYNNDNNFNNFAPSPVTQQPLTPFNIPPANIGNIHPGMIPSTIPGNSPSNMFHMMSITERESRILSPVNISQGNLAHNAFNHF